MLTPFRHAGFVELWHPGVMLLALILAALYQGLVGPWAARLAPGEPPTGWGRRLRVFGALALLYLAVGSPLDLLSDRYLMSAHMLEHVILAFWLPPLVITGLPRWAWERVAASRPWGAVLRRLTRPLTALVLFNLVFSVIHVPVLYDLALEHATVHLGEHALLVLAGCVFWWPVLHVLPAEPDLGDVGRMLYLFVSEILQTVVFALITFAPQPLYAWYVHAPRIWGISALEDQQAAGVIMRLGAMATQGVVLWITFFRWAGRAGSEFARGLGPRLMEGPASLGAAQARHSEAGA